MNIENNQNKRILTKQLGGGNDGVSFPENSFSSRLLPVLMFRKVCGMSPKT